MALFISMSGQKRNKKPSVCVCVCWGQWVMQGRLILRDRLPGPLSCSTHSLAVGLDCQSHRRDMNVTGADTKRGQGSAPIVTVTD